MSIAITSGRNRLGWLTADAAHGPLPALLIGLTVLTGVVDAVSILALGRVFVANMTGNVVFVGFALAGAAGFSLAASLAALAGFVVGARAGGQLIGRFGSDRAGLLAVGCAVELAFVAAALTVAAASGSGLSVGERVAVAAVLSIGTGIQNAVARRLAVPDLTTTVLTMTLTGLAADTTVKGNRSSAPRRSELARRLLAVAAMVAGAVAGAELVLNASATAALALATSILAVVTLAAAVTTRQPASWRTPNPKAR
jgi:uncharacterized membrane protein YoaK (UPF0700 family)